MIIIIIISHLYIYAYNICKSEKYEVGLFSTGVLSAISAISDANGTRSKYRTTTTLLSYVDGYRMFDNSLYNLLYLGVVNDIDMNSTNQLRDTDTKLIDKIEECQVSVRPLAVECATSNGGVRDL